MTDEQLMAGIRRGEPRAVEMFVEQFKSRIFKYLLGRTRDPEEALDVTQEVLIRVCDKAHNYDGHAPLAAWVFTIARNLQIDQRRRKNFKVVAGRVEMDENWQDRLRETRRNPEERLYGQNIFKRVESAIQALPERQREVVELRLLAELSLEEIAQAMDLTLGGVKSTLHNALTNLRRQLTDLKEEAYVNL